MKKDILATVKQCHKYLSVFRTHIHTQRVYINHFCYNFISKKIVWELLCQKSRCSIYLRNHRKLFSSRPSIVIQRTTWERNFWPKPFSINCYKNISVIHKMKLAKNKNTSGRISIQPFYLSCTKASKPFWPPLQSMYMEIATFFWCFESKKIEFSISKKKSISRES